MWSVCLTQPCYEDCDFLYFEPASVSKITEGMKTNFDSRHTERKKRKGRKKKPEMCQNNEISWCFLGRYGMMQTDAQLTSSPKDTDTQTPVEHLTATSKHTNLHVCRNSHWKPQTHTHTQNVFLMHETLMHIYFSVHLHSGQNSKLISWLIQIPTCVT